jgi:hypothetical protein
LKTPRNYGAFQAEYEVDSLHPLHHSKFLQDIADIVSQGDAPQALWLQRQHNSIAR